VTSPRTNQVMPCFFVLFDITTLQKEMIRSIYFIAVIDFVITIFVGLIGLPLYGFL